MNLFDPTALLQSSLNSKITSMLYGKINGVARQSRGMPESTTRAFTSRMQADARMAMGGAKNMDDAASLVKVAQSGVTAIKDKLTRMKELAIEGSTRDTMSDADYTSLQNSLQTLAKEIVDLAEHTSFNGISLLDGKAGMNSDGVIQLQAGNNPMEQVLNNLLDDKNVTNPNTVMDGNGNINMRNLQGLMQASDQATSKGSLGIIQTALDRITGIESDYSYDINSLTNMSILLKGQADILGTAQKNHEVTPEKDPQSYLLDLINGSTTGNIMSGLG